MTRWPLLVLLTCAIPAVGSADPKYGHQVRFAGIHPIPKSQGGGICYIEGPHVHVYAADKLEYREHGPDHVFVGDPVAYGFDGTRYSYNGPHPIEIDVFDDGPPETEYCYLRGPHFHSFAPPDGPEFEKRGDAYFYVAEPTQVFIEARPLYIGINDRYRPLVYDRPRIEVEPPRGWVGARAEFVAPVVIVERPRAAVGFDVRVPLPSLQIGVEIGGPAVIVHDREDREDREDRGEREGHWKHDNGRHEGWHKRH